MSFPRKLLNEGEDILLELHPHWWFFTGPVLAFIGATALTVVVAVYDLPTELFYVTLALLGLNILWLIGRLARWWCTNVLVTSDRLVFRSGVLSKEGKEIPLERVHDITFRQTFFERLLRSGDLMIESGGERGQQHFSDIAKPAQVQNLIYRAIEAAQARDIGRMAARRELSIPEQIEKLDELRQRGVVTQAEFDQKKAQLLERM